MNTSISLYDAINKWCNGTPFLDATIGNAKLPFQCDSSELPIALVEYSEKLARKRRGPFINDLVSAFSTLGERSAEQIKLPNTFKILELLVKLSSILREPLLLQPVKKLLSDGFLNSLNNRQLAKMLAESIFRCTYLTVYGVRIPSRKRAVGCGELSAAHGIVAKLIEERYLNELHSVAAMLILSACNADAVEDNLTLIAKIAMPERFTLPDNLPEAQTKLTESAMTAPNRIAGTLPALQRLGYTRLIDQLFPDHESKLYDAIKRADPEFLLPPKKIPSGVALHNSPNGI